MNPRRLQSEIIFSIGISAIEASAYHGRVGRRESGVAHDVACDIFGRARDGSPRGIGTRKHDILEKDRFLTNLRGGGREADGDRRLPRRRAAQSDAGSDIADVPRYRAVALIERSEERRVGKE